MRCEIRRLAVLGGVPAFDQPLHVGRPNLGSRQRFVERVDGALDRRWLTNDGPLVLEFEAAVAACVGVRHCVATCNATTALGIAARAAGLTGEILLPAFTFIATAHAMHWQGLTPVFCDVDPQTHNVDVASAAARITDRTSAILGVHVWGRPCPIDALTDLAERHGLTLLFDAAHALGSTYRGRMLGGFGDAEVLSFHATKVVSAGEGGAIVTNDSALADKARLLRNFGFVDYDAVGSLGINGKMSELSAAMGLTSLEAREDFFAANRRNHDAYRAGLDGLPDVRLALYDDREGANRHYVVVEVTRQSRLSRDQLLEVLVAERVLARRYFWPGVHRMAPYSARAEIPSLPAAERLAASVLVLPTGTAVDVAMIGDVCDIVRQALAESGRVAEVLASSSPSAR